MSKFSTEEKVRIVLDGMRYPEGITRLCLKMGGVKKRILSLFRVTDQAMPFSPGTSRSARYLYPPLGHTAGHKT